MVAFKLVGVPVPMIIESVFKGTHGVCIYYIVWEIIPCVNYSITKNVCTNVKSKSSVI